MSAETVERKSACVLAYDQHGGLLGVDWRRSGLAAPGYEVPGLIPADGVYPGDTLADGSLMLSWRRNGTPGCVYLVTRTPGGAEIVRELRTSERVQVVAVGAFDREPVG